MKREDMKAPCKFVVQCATCGEKKRNAVTRWTAQQWMHAHQYAHMTGFIDEPEDAK